MFIYNSIQTHTDTHSKSKNGKIYTKTNHVTVRGKTGYKMITVRNKSGRVTKKSKKRLSQKEIKCIEKCQFMPGLFKDCESCLD